MPYAFADATDRMVTLQRLVTAKVEATLARDRENGKNLLLRLQRIQGVAYKFGVDRQTLQVLTSGRRLLGDRNDLSSKTIYAGTRHDHIR